MSRRAPFAVSALALVLALPAAAAAQTAGPSYEARIRSALDLVASDREGAMRGFREAVAQDPSRADAYCYLAEAYRIGGDLTSALDNFQTCLNIARTAHSAAFAARGAHGVATTFERLGPTHYADARNAWTTYARLSEHPLVFPEIGREREAAIDAVGAAAERSAPVATRIRERVAAAAAAAGSH